MMHFCRFSVTRDDLVVAMPTDKRHFPIVEASKAWRKDMRTFVALANETVASEYAHFGDSPEVWGYYPDDEPLKGLHPGDSRAALTPFLAHEVCNIPLHRSYTVFAQAIQLLHTRPFV
jgi:hypothetical protein